MTIITQLEDRGAVIAWSPLLNNGDIVAIGVKDSGGIGFDDYGGELEIYDLSITSGNNGPKLLGSVKTASRFASLGWSSSMEGFPMGLIAGGMDNGVIQIWDPSLLLKNEESLITVISKQHVEGAAVSALQFNHHKGCTYELATGGSNGEVFITSLEDPHNPQIIFPTNNDEQALQGGEITKLAWNSQVAHILASSAGNGSVVVYDIKQRKPWCEIRCENSSGVAVADVAWNPKEGLHIITASSDDRNPVLKLFDLRSSTTVPLTTLIGHEKGILSLGWCPHDESLLVSCGKDNKTLLWDLYSLKPIYEFVNDASKDNINVSDPGTPSKSLFGGGLSTSQQRRYDVQWSPRLRGILSTCSFDRKVQIHSVIGEAGKSGRIPQWLKRPATVSTGFGGALISSGNSPIVTYRTVVEEPKLVTISDQFEQDIASKDFIEFCNTKSQHVANLGNIEEAKIWGFMQIIFEVNARENLLQYLGFDPEEIGQLASQLPNSETPDISNLSLANQPKLKVDEIVKQALIVGNFEVAVECCFQSGNYADGLVLSSCGGAELWAKTQTRYFELEASKRPFLYIVNAVINSQLEELVARSNPSNWRETLAILSTYGKSEEFPTLCVALGNRLEESEDFANASLCYMRAISLDKAVKHWKQQLDQANQNSLDFMALHSFVEKVAVFLQAMEPDVQLSPDVAESFYLYAKALSGQGLLERAAKYCRGDSQECKELKDLLYRSRASNACKAIFGSVPDFPFAMPNQAASSNVRERNNKPNQYQTQKNQTTQQNYQNPNELPSGWIALKDPNSGMTYYANQTTGETTWEKPSPPPQSSASTGYNVTRQQQTTVQPSQAQQYPAMQQNRQYHQNPQPQQQYPQVQQQHPQVQQQYSQPVNSASMQQHYKQSSGTNGTTTVKQTSHVKLESKYGDGFVSSASHPELAQQYGNIGTSNPYTGAERPGTAVVPNKKGATKPSISEDLDLNSPPPQLSPEQQHISDTLLSLTKTLSESVLNVSERKQLVEIQKSVAILLKKLSLGEQVIDQNTLSKIDAIVLAIQNRDYATASSIQTNLVNSHWREHKDWLKGIKFLIQLASRRL